MYLKKNYNDNLPSTHTLFISLYPTPFISPMVTTVQTCTRVFIFFFLVVLAVGCISVASLNHHLIGKDKSEGAFLATLVLGLYFVIMAVCSLFHQQFLDAHSLVFSIFFMFVTVSYMNGGGICSSGCSWWKVDLERIISSTGDSLWELLPC